MALDALVADGVFVSMPEQKENKKFEKMGLYGTDHYIKKVEILEAKVKKLEAKLRKAKK